MPLNGLQAPVRFHADRLYGDKSGFLHVGYNQSFTVAVTDPDIPFGLRVYENGSLKLPRRAFLQTVSFKSSGKVCLIVQGFFFLGGGWVGEKKGPSPPLSKA